MADSITKSTYQISGMDCPSEERMIRMQLEGLDGLFSLRFNLEGRLLEVYHKTGIEDGIFKELQSLNMGAKLVRIAPVDSFPNDADNSMEKRVLWTVLAINFAFFLIEMITGLVSKSMGLVADSLDMLADSFVYGLALIAVGTTVRLKKRVAKISGFIQIILALLGFAEVIRRFVGDAGLPDFRVMMIVSGFALVANVFCLWLLKKAKSDEAHIQASVIFTSNDVIINLGVILAGILVWFFNSATPDLIIGSFVFLIVMRGAWRILSLAR